MGVAMSCKFNCLKGLQVMAGSSALASSQNISKAINKAPAGSLPQCHLEKEIDSEGVKYL